MLMLVALARASVTRARISPSEMAAAWTTLVGQQQEAVFRLAYLLLGDADEAQDVAQEAFIRAFRALHRFDPARPLRPWLLSITANLVRQHLPWLLAAVALGLLIWLIRRRRGAAAEVKAGVGEGEEA